MRKANICLATLIALAVTASGSAAAEKDKKANKQPAIRHGIVVLLPTKDYKAAGTLRLTQTKEGVQIKGEVSGLEPGLHGFHIHEFGDTSDPAGLSAGGHFNPTGEKHGGPHDEERHAGDFGNIEADSSGVAKVNILAKELKLRQILGRSFVVHAKADDLKSQPSGDAGPRAAVGVVAITEGKGKKK